MYEPRAKKKRTWDPSKCIICFDALEGSCKGPHVKRPSEQGLQSIINRAHEVEDRTYEQILPHIAAILNFSCPASYHISCRSSYTSTSNQKHGKDTTTTGASTSQPKAIRLTRSSTAAFDIRINCFICG